MVPERQPATDRWPLNSITLNPMPYKAQNGSVLLYIGFRDSKTIFLGAKLCWRTLNPKLLFLY